MVTAF